MIGIVAPASDAIFKVPNKPPQNDGEWTALQNSALILAEAGNLLLLPGRARALVDAGSAAFKAANAKDANALTDIGDKIDETCETCHAKYLPKQ
jgi:hypothetical protein